MKNLFEEITVKQTKFGEYNVYYVNPESKEEKDIIFQNKALLSKYGAKWNGINKIWFWFVDKENPQKTLDKIRLALDELNQIVTPSTPIDGSQEAQKLLIDIDKVLAAIDVENPAKNPDFKLSPQDEEQIKGKLESFKQMLVNIDTDEQFKETMKAIIDLKAAQGYEFSLANSLLIFIQSLISKRKISIVNSKSNWQSKYNRTVNPNAKPLVVWAPEGARFNQPKDKIETLKAEFYKNIGKKQGQPLTPNEKFQLDKITKAKVMATRFKLVPVYDASDTTQIEGTEDYIKKAQDSKKEIKTFANNMVSEEVRPIYNGLLDYAKENDIEVEMADDLGGARGVSKSGKIEILKNEGNDVGLTKTLAHEITHELLHQKYLQQKGKETGKYYIGQIDRGVVEQQAELSAWMFMYAFGFDVNTTSLNYTVMWGGNKENMVRVFDTVSKVVNHLIDYVNKKLKQPVDEEQGAFNHGKHISPHEIAQVLGMEKTYDKLTHNELHERLLKKFVK